MASGAAKNKRLEQKRSPGLESAPGRDRRTDRQNSHS